MIFTPTHGVWRTIRDVLFGLLLFTGAAYTSYYVFSSGPASPERPRVVKDLWLEPTTVLSGRSFKAHLKVRINQLCPAEVHWSIVRVSDNEEVSKTVQPAITTKLGDNEFINTRMVPSTVPPGEYYYASTIYDFCGPDRTTFLAVTKHIPISVR
jgi:hypothetical protein